MDNTNDQPAATAPPELRTDFNQNSDLWPSIITVSTICLFLMTSAFAVRAWSGVMKPRNRKLEDCLLAFGLVFMIIWTVIFDVCCHLGITKHQWNVRASVMPRIFNYLNILDIIYGPMLGCAKLSLLLQLHHYSSLGRTNSGIRRVIIATGVIIFGYYFSCIFMFAFQCVPRDAIWNGSTGARCISGPASTFAAGGFGLLTDFLLFLIFVWSIHTSRKVQLAGWLCLGSIMVVALFGIATASATLYYRLPLVGHATDVTYHVGIVGLWSIPEYAAIIVSGCIPSFKVIFGKSSVQKDVERSYDEEDLPDVAQASSESNDKV